MSYNTIKKGRQRSQESKSFESSSPEPESEPPELRSPEPRSPKPRSPEPRSPVTRSPEPRSPESRSPKPRSPEPKSPEAAPPETVSLEPIPPEPQPQHFLNQLGLYNIIKASSETVSAVEPHISQRARAVRFAPYTARPRSCWQYRPPALQRPSDEITLEEIPWCNSCNYITDTGICQHKLRVRKPSNTLLLSILMADPVQPQPSPPALPALRSFVDYAREYRGPSTLSQPQPSEEDKLAAGPSTEYRDYSGHVRYYDTHRLEKSYDDDHISGDNARAPPPLLAADTDAIFLAIADADPLPDDADSLRPDSMRRPSTPLSRISATDEEFEYNHNIFSDPWEPSKNNNNNNNDNNNSLL